MTVLHNIPGCCCHWPLRLASAWLLLIPLARKAGWVDHPGGRKLHLDATPLVGGVAIFLALAAGFAMSPIPTIDYDLFCLVVIACAAALLLTGLVDDLYNLSATLRFLLQVGICLLMVKFGHTRLEDLGSLFSGDVLELGWMAVPITVFAAMGVINSFNLIDGMDGLSSTFFLVAAGGMALFATSVAILWLLIIAIGAVLGFMLLNARLPWNEKARVFLGDAGSLMLGFILAWCFIRLGNGPDQVFMPMTAVWLFAVPLLDASCLIWRRWGEGRSAFAADQNHLHHAFSRAVSAWSKPGCAWLCCSRPGGFGIGFEMSKLPEWLSFYTFMAVAFMYYFYLKHSWASQRFLGRHFIHHDFILEEGYT
jgi:UDP-GlcNAc:undecaprenyl-phosphate GlcNAc-1-phosphate transferase